MSKPENTRAEIIDALATQIAIESNAEGKMVVKNSRLQQIKELLTQFAEEIRRSAQ